MKTKKILFDVLFILLSAGILIALNKYGLLEKYSEYAIIPIIAAYSLGKYSQQKFSSADKEEKVSTPA